MKAFWIDQQECWGGDNQSKAYLASKLSAAEAGDAGACFDLGISFSTGTPGFPRDLIEAHKWFDIAAASGHKESAMCRVDLAHEMSARDVAEAQRRALQWLKGPLQQAA